MNLVPNYIFETSWEVCNKVGGIYTVLSTRAKSLKSEFNDNLIFIGPSLENSSNGSLFKEDKKLLPAWGKAAKTAGLDIKIGRWQIPGEPVTILVDFRPFYNEKNDIYAEAWANFCVDSLNAYGDYDESSMFSYAAGKLVATIANECLKATDKVVYQAHEWMSGLGMLYVKKEAPQVATIFTTHATSIGRSICGNDKPLYDYFEGYNGDIMARELNMEAKHSIEKQAAHHADCFTTVSSFTAKECEQLLDKKVDKVLMNGFEADFVPKAAAFTSKRKKARKTMLNVASALTGTTLPDDTIIVSTSGRNDFRCKGFDTYLEALKRLNDDAQLESDVLALIEVPCWTKEPRKDLQERLAEGNTEYSSALSCPQITHTLYNMDSDRILTLIKDYGFHNSQEQRVKVVLIPCYLDGNDGIFNVEYYDLLIGNDICIYPSYYEPWGYTPLEAVAFKIPCVTTDLSGFGQWVEEIKSKHSQLEDGVDVIHRTDSNYFCVAEEIKNDVLKFSKMTPKEIQTVRKRASLIADKALWKNFIAYYYEAYDFALKASEERNK